MVQVETKLTFSIVVCLLIATPGCYHRVKIKSRKVIITHHYLEQLRVKNNDAQQKQPTITIWVHGTRLLSSPLFKKYLYCEPGLNKAKDLPSSYFLRALTDALTDADPARFNKEDFYLFGWSGKLSAATREQAAKDLHEDLKKLIQTYKKTYGIEPNIRLITHSHGGNIALNLARFKEINPKLVIHDLILFACPVQSSTKHYLKDEMFKNIYSLYSSMDLAQVLAPQFYWLSKLEEKIPVFKFPPFSSRLFSNQENLIQVKVKMNKHAIMHTEFSSDRFTKYLPALLYELECWNKEEPQYLDTWYTKRLLKVYTP